MSSTEEEQYPLPPQRSLSEFLAKTKEHLENAKKFDQNFDKYIERTVKITWDQNGRMIRSYPKTQ